jgi:hypothetical protein
MAHSMNGLEERLTSGFLSMKSMPLKANAKNDRNKLIMIDHTNIKNNKALT